jgi:hypothetical protein
MACCARRTNGFQSLRDSRHHLQRPPYPDRMGPTMAGEGERPRAKRGMNHPRRRPPQTHTFQSLEGPHSGLRKGSIGLGMVPPTTCRPGQRPKAELRTRKGSSSPRVRTRGLLSGLLGGWICPFGDPAHLS